MAVKRYLVDKSVWARTGNPSVRAVLMSLVQQGLLAEKGMHREASIPDLLIAATAERHGVTVLHYDGDFEHIAEVTGQPVEWVVERGSVP
ncbi:PIN domain-containing protein [Streptomyces sp. NPDC002680]|uniref:PIN domain-containing protein n=1 Tax=Streptomyces sp. NPDC002680 TaxID=3364659 RepID=UPI0036CCEED3